jgi:hypothetical protein
MGSVRYSSGSVPRGHDAAVVDDDHAVGQALDLLHVVRGVDESLALSLQRQQVVEDGVAASRVDTGRRLVEQQHLGVVHQRAGNVQPALHAAAVGGRFVACAVGQPDGGQNLGGAAPGAGRGQAVEGAEQLDIRLCRQVFEQCQVLRHQADAALAGGFVLRQRRAAHQHAASVGWGQATDHGDGGRLAGAIRPQQAQHLAGRHVERDVNHRSAFAVRLSQAFGPEQLCPSLHARPSMFDAVHRMLVRR